MIKFKHISIISFFLLFVIAITILISNTLTSVSALVPTPQKLIVNGKSELNFKPDTAEICVGVETINSSVQTAQKENAETMDKIIETLVSAGIEKSNIKTNSYNIFNRHDYCKGEEYNKTQVSNFICFKTTNLENISNLITKLTEAGANSFKGITFSLSDSTAAYNEALSAAINNAKQKTETLAPNVNFETMEIVEEYSYVTNCYLDNFAKSEMNETFVIDGDVTVCANVKVIFKNSLEKQNNSINNNNNVEKEAYTNSNNNIEAPNTTNIKSNSLTNNKVAA